MSSPEDPIAGSENPACLHVGGQDEASIVAKTVSRDLDRFAELDTLEPPTVRSGDVDMTLETEFAGAHLVAHQRTRSRNCHRPRGVEIGKLVPLYILGYPPAFAKMKVEKSHFVSAFKRNYSFVRLSKSARSVSLCNLMKIGRVEVGDLLKLAPVCNPVLAPRSIEGTFFGQFAQHPIDMHRR